jgi:uncharacterized protein YjbI with pentapeptide repeats
MNSPAAEQLGQRSLDFVFAGLLLLCAERYCNSEVTTTHPVIWKGVLNHSNTITLESIRAILTNRLFKTVQCSNDDVFAGLLSEWFSRDQTRTNVQVTDLSSSKLDELELTNADFNHVLLTNASLSNGRFPGVSFYHADLSSSFASSTDFSPGPRSTRSLFMHSDWFPSPDPTAWDDYQRSDFRGAKLVRSYLSGSVFARADCRGADFSKANLTSAIFTNALLTGAIWSDAELAGANFSDANLVNANLERVGGWTNRILRRSWMSEFWKADFATFSNAVMAGAKLNHADLRGCSFINASFEDADLTGCQFWSADLQGVLFEPKLGCLPDLPSLATARNLAGLRFEYSSSALASVRKWFRESGLQRQDREVTFAINRSRRLALTESKGGKRFEGWFRFVCFELTCDYGMSPWRPLTLVAFLVPIFAIPYTVSIILPGRSGILAARPPDFSRASQKKPAVIRVFSQRSLGTLNRAGPLQAGVSRVFNIGIALRKTYVAWIRGGPTKKIIGRFCRDVFLQRSKSRSPKKAADKKMNLLRRVDFFLRAIVVGTYFSILSGTRIGFREFNIGSWLSRLQCREYVLHGVGWVRFLVGVQSLISVYLLALWVLSYFGHPFD